MRKSGISTDKSAEIRIAELMASHRELQLDPVVWRMNQILFDAQIPLGCPNRGVSKQHLDLLQLPTAARHNFVHLRRQSWGRDSGNASHLGVALDKLPDHLLVQPRLPDLAASIQGAEHCAVGDPGGLLPRHRWRLRTSRHRYGPHPAMLAHQIDDAPSAIPLLDVLARKRRDLRRPQSPREHREDGAQPFGGSGIRRVQSAWACFAVNQLPRRTPLEATPFTRVMPLASSGAAARCQRSPLPASGPPLSGR